jgi:hypothetical protein
VPTLPWSVTLLSLLFPRFGSAFARFVWNKLSEELSWEHLGEPIYFTAQWQTIPDNHTIPVYKKALGVT